MLNYYIGITHCTFKCKKFNEMRTFYRDILGLKEVFLLEYQQSMIEKKGTTFPFKAGDIWISYLKVNDGQFIELFNDVYDCALSNKDYSFEELELEIDDVHGASIELEKKGINLINAVYRNLFVEKFSIVDPEGNRVSICESEK